VWNFEALYQKTTPMTPVFIALMFWKSCKETSEKKNEKPGSGHQFNQYLVISAES